MEQLIFDVLAFLSRPDVTLCLIAIGLGMGVVRRLRRGSNTTSANQNHDADDDDFAQVLWRDLCRGVQGGVAYVRQRQAESRGAAVHTGIGLAAHDGQQSRTVAGVVQADERGNGAPLMHQRWMALLNDQPDSLPHIIIRGGSGAGKTTLARAILSGRRGAAIILSPKPDDRPRWPNLSFVTIDRDGTYSLIAKALSDMVRVTRERNVATLDDPHIQHEPLTVLIDDAGVLSLDRTTAEPLRDALLCVGRIGRSVRIRLLVIADSSNSRTLGIEGEAASLGNFALIDVDRNRRATLTVAGESTPLDTAAVPQLAARPLHLHATALSVYSHSAHTVDGQNQRVQLAPEYSDHTEKPGGFTGPLQQTDQTNRQTDGEWGKNGAPKGVSVCLPRGDRAALVRFLVREHGWNTADLRSTIRGDNDMLGELYRQAQHAEEA